MFRVACAIAVALAIAAGTGARAFAQPASTLTSPSVSAPASTGPARGNILNPDISVVGWIQYATDDLSTEEEEGEIGASPKSARAGRAAQADESESDPPVTQVREVELGLQSAIDPYSRADIFIAFSPEEGVDVEEAYLTFLSLPGSVQARLGKHRSFVSRFNRTHPPEAAFATRPLVTELFFGEEGLFVEGGSLSRLVPNPWDLYVNIDVEFSNAPEEGAVFAPADREDLLFGGRASAFADLSEAVNVTLGTSFYRGPAKVEEDAAARHATLSGGDVTLRWKDPRRATYRSFLWATEMLSASDGESARATGLFTHAEYQFARRWRTGARYDWTEIPAAGAAHESGVLGYITFNPSEFSLFSAQFAAVRDEAGEWDQRLYGKVTFSMGPHGGHAF
ncbi:MAG: hypothetical protein ACKVU1_02280 [bacterium]